MTDPETMREDAKRERHEEKMESLMPGECGDCGASEWNLVDTFLYGDDADGNRGVPMRVWGCRECDNETEVIYD